MIVRLRIYDDMYRGGVTPVFESICADAPGVNRSAAESIGRELSDFITHNADEGREYEARIGVVSQ